MNRRLYRSDDDRVIAGVAGGMAETYDLDPALVRIGWVVLALLTGGVIVLVYIVMALVVPLASSEHGFAASGGSWPGTWPPSPTPGRTADRPQSNWNFAAGPPPQSPEGDPVTADQAAPAETVTAEGGTAQMPAPPLYMSERDRRRALRAERGGRADMTGPLVFGLLLILVGAFFLVRDYLPQIAWGQIWPIVLIAIGLVLVLAAFRRPRG